MRSSQQQHFPVATSRLSQVFLPISGFMPIFSQRSGQQDHYTIVT
jgi:hypothetical protein